MELDSIFVQFFNFKIYLVNSNSSDISFSINTLSTAAPDCIASIIARIPKIKCSFSMSQRYKKTIRLGGWF